MLNETFNALGLEKHPDKTFIGRVERGFDFLGDHLAPGRLTLSRATVERFVERAHRLYELERGEPEGFPRLGAYVRRWRGWARGGFGGDMRPLPRAISRMSPCDQGEDTSQLSPVFVTSA